MPLHTHVAIIVNLVMD